MQGIGADNSSTHKFLAFDAAGAVYNGTAYVAWVDANVAAYLLTAARIGTTSGYYAATPAGAARWELWYWTGTLATSYPVYDGEIQAPLVLDGTIEIDGDDVEIG